MDNIKNIELSVTIRTVLLDTVNTTTNYVYTNKQQEQEALFKLLDVNNEEALEVLLDEVSYGDHDTLYTVTRDSHTLPLLECLEIPISMARNSYSLYEVKETTGDYVNYSTHLMSDDGQIDALDLAIAFDRNLTGDDKITARDNFWDPESSTLTSNGIIVQVQNIRSITPAQAILFKAVHEF